VFLYAEYEDRDAGGYIELGYDFSISGEKSRETLKKTN
jgi:hypothetical protein